MDAALNERTLTTEMVKSVGSCDQLDEVVETYTNASDKLATLPFHVKLEAWTETPWWSPELEGLKRGCAHKEAAHPKCPAVVGVRGRGYVQAREVYWAVAEAQTASWKRFCSAQDGESTASTGSSGNRKNREDVL
ncbi:hypothetical protein EVAR_89384_1 [Eumeta japonica]|uniref:Uncharacterized protein n=1 Tax=Eumeta variegata TaxID=151549 RepID=A0A4C1XPY0_EUMVA|nr:hypothetical protein EVAR_89384_1 [Eumeta japonica]